MNKVTCLSTSVVTYTFTLMVLRWHFQVDYTGTVSDPLHPGKMAMPKQHGNLRDHVINLLGWCEICLGHFAIHFVQHRGSTNVYSSRVIVDTESIPSPDTPF